MRKMKILLLLVLVALIAGGYLYYRQWRKEEFLPAKENMITVNLEQVDRPVYIKAKIWGIAGNNEVIVLSLSNAKVANKESDYIFYTNEVYYKTDKKRTITVYAPESLISEPQNKLQSVIVDIVGLKNANEIKDYSLNYKKYGLSKVSVYKNE